MTQLATRDLWAIFDARRVKAPELKGLDTMSNAVVGYVKNRRPILRSLRAAAMRIEAMEEEIHNLGAERFREEGGEGSRAGQARPAG